MRTELGETARKLMYHIPPSLRPIEAEATNLTLDQVVEPLAAGSGDLDSSYLGHVIQFGWRYQRLREPNHGTR